MWRVIKINLLKRDFKKLDKVKIFTLHHSAIQQIDTTLTSEQVKIATLETELAAEKAKVSTLESEVSDEKAKVVTLESEVAIIKTHLGL